MSYLPPNLQIAAKQMSNYTRNRFRLETSSTKNELKAGDVITCNLPENALLDMKSFRLIGNASSTVKDTSNISMFPAGLESLVGSCEIFINGVQVQSTTQYNTLARILKIGRDSNDRNNSTANILAKSHIVDVGDAPQSATAPDFNFCIDKWIGFLNECSSRFLPTDLLGQISLKITLAPNSVMIPFRKESSHGYTLDPSNPEVTLADLNYTLKDVHFTIDSLVVDPIYSQALRQQLISSEDAIAINYKDYYTFQMNAVGTSYQNRFALSSGSIDKMYATQRKSTYANGLKAQLRRSAVVGADKHVGSYFVFEALTNSGADADPYSGKPDDFRYQWKINNIAHPQYRAQLIEAAADLAYVNDKCSQDSNGILPHDMTDFKETSCVIPLVLNHPETPISVRSGYNSMGINSVMVFDATGVKENPATGLESTVVVEVTSQLRVAQGKSLGVSH